VFADRRLVDIVELVLKAQRDRLIGIIVLLEVGVYHFDEIFWEGEGEVCRCMVDRLRERSFADLSKGQYGAKENLIWHQH
jgi:hypothetical protein